MGDFQEGRLANGLRLHLFRTTKFKTNTLRLFIQEPMGAEVTATALLPFVLRRGTAGHPTTPELSAVWEDLYGAEFRVDILKLGDRQLQVYGIDIVNESFLPEPEELLSRALGTLREVLLEPRLEGDLLAGDFVGQEKENLRRMIEGVINDKTRYASLRCTEIMGRGAPYAAFRYGRTEDLPGISPVELTRRYHESLQGGRMDLYAVGDLSLDELAERAERLLGFQRSERALPNFFPSRPNEPERLVREELPVHQGKLVLGLWTGRPPTDPLYPALVVANGLLGGFSHSKLFQNVREKASLAYYAYSRLDSLLGLMQISAGIEFSDFERTVEIIRAQVGAVQAGDFTAEELDNTKKALRNRVLAAEDSPGQKILTSLELDLEGRNDDLAERLAALERVTPEEVQAVAGDLEYDTVYFLTRGEEAP